MFESFNKCAIILFHNRTKIKYKSNAQFYVFFNVLSKIVFLTYVGNAHKNQISFVTYAFQGLPLCSSAPFAMKMQEAFFATSVSKIEERSETI